MTSKDVVLGEPTAAQSPLQPAHAPAERNTHHRPGRSGGKQQISTADEKMTVDVPERTIGQLVTL
jgi:hypothetical protein